MSLAVVMTLVFVAALLLAYGGLELVFSEERAVKRNLRRLSTYEAEQAMIAEPMLQPFRQRVLGPAFTGTLGLIRKLSPIDYRKRLDQRLTIAGHPRGIDADTLFFAKVAGAGGVFALSVLVAIVGTWSVRNLTLVALALVLAAFFAPDVWLSRVMSRRQGDIRRALPDALDMLVVSVEAGLGFDAAVSKLVANTTGPLTQELGRMLSEVRAGAARRDALRQLAERTQVPELGTFVTAMVQADLFGISVGNVLRTQASEMRTKRRQQAEEMAQKAPVKLVFPLVLCILPATLLVVLGPAIISIATLFGAMK